THDVGRSVRKKLVEVKEVRAAKHVVDDRHRFLRLGQIGVLPNVQFGELATGQFRERVLEKNGVFLPCRSLSQRSEWRARINRHPSQKSCSALRRSPGRFNRLRRRHLWLIVRPLARVDARYRSQRHRDSDAEIERTFHFAKTRRSAPKYNSKPATMVANPHNDSTGCECSR